MDFAAAAGINQSFKIIIMQPNFTLKKKGFFLRYALMLFVLVSLFAGKVNAQCVWTASTVQPLPNLDQGVVTVGTNLYKFAGVDNGAIVASSSRFDGTTWTAIAPVPTAVEFPSAVTDGTNAYILGGALTGTGAPQTTLYRYNVGTNTYTTLAPFSTGTWNQAAVFLGGKIYKFAGSAAASTNVLEIYDIATNTWTVGAPYPLAISFVSAVAQGGFIYAGGGIQSVGSLASAKTYRYDPVANTWNDAAIADLPATRWGAASAYYNNGFIMAGGYVGGSVTANISTSVLSWDPLGNSWSALPAMLGERSRMAGAILNGSFYVLGGRSIASAGFVGTNNNQRLNCVPLVPCAGTPVPGNTLSSVNPACPNANFILSTQTPPASGLTYQWQSGPSATGPWTNMGAGATQTTSQTVATFYQCIVSCGANSATSTPLQVTMNNFNNCYCLPIYTNACAFGDFIARVRLGALDNSSVCTGQFTYYNALPAPDIYPGITQTVSVSVGPDTFGQWVGVWIDYNQDGIFSPAEFLAAPVNAGANGTVNVTFTVPPGATLGTTRMRVRAGDDVAMTSAQSCGASNSTFGEAEDYNVNITPCVQGVFTAQPASPTIQCSNNTSFTFAATGSLLTYSWEYRVNSSSPWLTVPNVAPYSGANTTTLTLLNVPATFNGYQYRGLMVGPCTAVDFTNVATLTVNPLVATVSPTSSTICLGTLLPLTLTNPTSVPIYGAPSGLPAAIPDASLAGANSTINVSNVPVGAVVTSIVVQFSVPAHTWVGDLVAVLKAPNGNVLNLDYGISATGVSGTGMINTKISSIGVNALSTGSAPYSLTYRPDAQLVPAPSLGNAPVGPTGFQSPLVNSFAGLTSTLNGNWIFAIYDAFGGDVGSLTAWSIVINYVAPPAQGVWAQVSPATPPNTMFSDAAGLVPYVAGTPANTIYVRPTVNSSYSVVYSTPTPCVSAPTVIPVNVVNPVVLVSSPANTAACIGNNATFSVGATGGPLTYQWQVSINNGLSYTNISGQTGSSLTLTAVTALMNNNLYRAVISAAPCVGSTNSLPGRLTVNALPVVSITSPDLSITPGQTTTITGVSSPAAQVAPPGWSWTLNGGAIAGTTNTQVVGIDGFGTYQATVKDINGCIAKSNELVIGAEASERLWIYPNPTNGAFQVRLFYGGSISERRIVSIFKSNGQMVVEKEFPLYPGSTNPYLRMDFDFSDLAAGTYVVKVHNVFTGKIVSGLVVVQ